MCTCVEREAGHRINKSGRSSQKASEIRTLLLPFIILLTTLNQKGIQ
jgi:hypothetical protein